MAALTIHVNEDLKKRVLALAEKGHFSVDEAIRAYLSEIVRTRSLPIDLRLRGIPDGKTGIVPYESLEKEIPAAPAPVTVKDADPDDWSDLPVPAITPKPGVEAFVALVCSIPAGKLSCWSDLEKALTAKAGFEVSKPLRAEWPKFTGDGLAIPYWRVLSDRGTVKADVTCSRELREAMLLAEGHEFSESARGRGTVRTVKNYKAKTVRFDV